MTPEDSIDSAGAKDERLRSALAAIHGQLKQLLAPWLPVLEESASTEHETVIATLKIHPKCVFLLTLSARTPGAALSPREQEVARLVANGYSNKEIATTLKISPHTVKEHLKRSCGKLKIHSRLLLSQQSRLLS